MSTSQSLYSSSYLSLKQLATRDEYDTHADADERLSDDEAPAATNTKNEKKKRGKGRIYHPFVSFQSKKAGLAALDGELDGSYWSKESVKEKVDGEQRLWFTCKAPKCSKRAFMMLHVDHQGVTLHISDGEHQHTEAEEKGLPRATVEKIKQLIDEGIFLPRSIACKIRELGLQQITTKQLSNFKTRYMMTKFGKSSGLLNELIDWCDKRGTIPESMDEVFVAGSKFQVSAAVKIEIFCIIMSTKRLLSFAMKSKNFFIIKISLL
jgi:hypothetical protein